MANTESVSHDALVVCACGGQDFTARDAVEAALFRGDLGDLWQLFLQRVAAEKRADADELELDEETMDAAAAQFRYERDLITAEETEQWLAARGLDLDDFTNYFTRQVFLQSIGEEVVTEEIDYPSAPGDLRQLFAVELILSGDLDRMTDALGWRLAAAAAAAADEVGADRMEAERRHFFERHDLTPEQLPEWLQRINRDTPWFEKMLHLEAEYRRRAESLLTPQTRQREMALLRLPLTRFETEVIELESHDAAKEALFCVREDGMSMEEVANEGRYPFKVLSFLQEDIPEDLQPRFLSVTAGEVLEPLTRGDAFELYRVISKTEPQTNDPAVCERVDRILLSRHFSELVARHVETRLPAAGVDE